jgi:hypothetical protein
MAPLASGASLIRNTKRCGERSRGDAEQYRVVSLGILGPAPRLSGIVCA